MGTLETTISTIPPGKPQALVYPQHKELVSEHTTETDSAKKITDITTIRRVETTVTLPPKLNVNMLEDSVSILPLNFVRGLYFGQENCILTEGCIFSIFS